MRIGKKGIVTDYLGWILIAVAVLVLGLMFTDVLGNKGQELWEALKEKLRFG